MLDGQTVDVDKPFKVDGYELMYPGDTSAPGYLVYNCRCTQIAEVDGEDTSSGGRRARNPKTGESVLVGDMTYAEWAGWKKQNQPKMPRFTPATTIEEAQKYADKFVESYKTKYSGKVDYSGIDIEYANKMNRAFTEVLEQYAVPNKLRNIVPFNMREKRFKDTTAEAAYQWGLSDFYYNKKWISTYEPGSNPNPDLRWEKKKEFNVGLDMSVLDNRLNVTVDYYNRRTKDLLYTYTVPVPPNLYPSKFANVGTIDNKGIEVTVNATPISRKNFSWNLAATISHNKNNLVKFSNEDYEMVQIQTGYFPDDLKMYTMRIVEGGSLGNFWGPKFVGFNDNGGAIYEDLDGVEGITEADYQVIGNAYPDVLLSLQNTFSYKQWSLSFLLRSSIGNDVLNQSRVYYEGFGYFGTRNILRSTLDHANYKDGAYYSSRFVEDGSYLKLDNITLSYDFKLKSKVISKLRCYVTAQNLFTITGYKGIDPEVSISGLQPGIDWYDFYPRTRTFVLGAAIAF